jgi:hypothetical protein
MRKSISREPLLVDRNSGHAIGKPAPLPVQLQRKRNATRPAQAHQTPTVGATMTGLRGSTQHTLTTPVRFSVQPITLALVALLVATLLAAAIVLAASGEGDQADAPKSVRVAPSTPTAGDIQRTQPPGVNGPGARP